MPPASKARKATRQVTKKTANRKLSAAHKQALADGRTMSATVDRYLDALNTPKRRGPKVSTAKLQQRLTAAQARFQSETGAARVYAAQDIRDLRAKIAEQSSAEGTDLTNVETAFIKIAKTFGERRGITYSAWRDAGVPPVVLRKAGIARTRG